MNELIIGGVAIVFFSALHNALGHLSDLLHEGIALHLALLDERKFVLPAAS